MQLFCKSASASLVTLEDLDLDKEQIEKRECGPLPPTTPRASARNCRVTTSNAQCA